MGAWRFADPIWLWGLALLPLLVSRHILDIRRRQTSLRFPRLGVLAQVGPTLRGRLRHGLVVLRVGGLGLLTLAMARPQAGEQIVDLRAEGIDIMLVLDVSGSMKIKDLGPTSRLAVAKEVVADFIDGRRADRIGMVVFAAESYTQCPLTLDYEVLLKFIDQLSIADKSWDGTAIGMALITAVNRLRDSTAESKVIVLLTDGVNNAGEIGPETAAAAAAAMGIRVYAVGVGSGAGGLAAALRGRRHRRTEFDEASLMAITDRTGGRYFHATSQQKLGAIYREIGELETTQISSEMSVAYVEQFGPLLWGGLSLLLAELLLANTYLRRIP